MGAPQRSHRLPETPIKLGVPLVNRFGTEVRVVIQGEQVIRKIDPVVRLKLQGLLEIGQGTVNFAQALVCDAKIVESFRVVGLELQGTIQGIQPGLEFADFLQQMTQVAMHLRVQRQQLGRLALGEQGLIQLALRMEHDPQRLPGKAGVRVLGNQFAGPRFASYPVALAEQLDQLNLVRF